jgi:cytochrome d ubiquinol oxidase subunit II
MWHGFWDVCFAGASALLILIFGVTLGNLVRGLPLGAHGYFLGTLGFLLNWYALLVGMFATATLAQHGATFLAMRIDGPPAERAQKLLPVLWLLTLILFFVVTIATFVVHPAGWGAAWVKAVGLFSLASLLWLRLAVARRRERSAFTASCAFIATLLISAAGTLYPFVIPGYPAQRGGLSIFDAAAPPIALASAIAVTIVGLVSVAGYGWVVWRKMAEKILIR